MTQPVSRLPTPLYHQIQLVLRERIEHGAYGRDGLLPSEMELGREFQVSRITIARAINDLAALGLVERRRGAGTRVIRNDLPAPIPADIDGLIENLTEMGARTQVRVLEFGFVPPPADVQSELGAAPGELVQRAVRVRSYHDEPFSYLTSFVPGILGHRFGEDDLRVHSLIGLLEKNGVKVGSARQNFSAVLADPKVAQALDVPVGAPLLSITRTVCDRDGRPVEYIKILYRPDRYQYRMTMDRQKEGASRTWVAADRRPRVAGKGG